jgi:hypothetical protein
MTPAQVAARLRVLADLLDVTADPAPLRLYLSLSVPRYFTDLNEPRRAAAVTAVAAALGMTAAPEPAASGWRHQATEHGDGFTVVVHTDIAGPRVCACGAACTHSSGRAAAA